MGFQGNRFIPLQGGQPEKYSVKGGAAVSQLTKKAIMASFVNLISKTPLDKITVKDIVEDCGVNRNTFYYYFQDIYALVEELFRDETGKSVAAEYTYDSWAEGFLRSARFAAENKKAVYHIYNSSSRGSLEAYLYEVTGTFMEQYVKREAEGLDVTDDDRTFIVNFYKHALAGLIVEWLKGGMEGDPENITKKLQIFFASSIRAALEKASGRAS